MKVWMQVSFDLPDGATPGDARAYVEDAVTTWCGSLEPIGVDSGDGTLTEGNPMFDLDKDSVRVTLVPFLVNP